MAFRKRNIGLGSSTKDKIPSDSVASDKNVLGVKPSSLTSHPVISTGASSLDSLLGGHGGLALGSSILIEESGTTDFAGALLRYYAAEGICHGHVIHVVGMGETWVRELPGVASDRSTGGGEDSKVDEEKMKIAWRYERLGQVGERASPDRTPSSQAGVQQQDIAFCHTFDLTKRLPIPQHSPINHIKVSPASAPFNPIIESLRQTLQTSPPNSIHRVVMPTILSPALYPPQACHPQNVIRFLQSLRALLKQHPARLTAMITLPLELHPRTSGLVRLAETLSDGVLELTPFPHLMDTLAESGGATSKDEQPQGLVKVHKVPVDTERGEGGAGVGNSMGEDLAFTVSRRKFVIKPFSLPPMEGDQEAQGQGGALTGKDVEF